MPCALTMGNTLGCNDGFGGIKTLYLTNQENLTGVTEASGVVSAITKAVGKRFFKYDLVPFTAEMKNEGTSSRENGSVEVKQTVSLIINKMTSAMIAEMKNLLAANVVCVAVDNNDIAHLLGREYGLNTSVNGMSGKALKDRNGFEITLTGMERAFAPTVAPAVLATLETIGA